MRSLYTGVSGMLVHQTKLDVIANNIANVNTLSFKSERVNFSDVLSQTIQKANGGNAATGRGNTNPMQVGLGSAISSIDKLMTPGVGQRTDDPMNVMIEGDGFFVVSDDKGQYLTRAGNFSVDDAGYLNINGYLALGWDAAIDETTKNYEIQVGPVAPIVITDEKKTLAGQASTQVNFKGNLNATENRTDGVESSMTVYDSEGKKYSIPMIFKYSEEHSTADSSVWTYEIKRDSGGFYAAYPADGGSPVRINFSASQGDTASWYPLGALVYDTNGKLSAFDTGENTLNPPANSAEGRTQLELFLNVAASGDNAPAFGDGGNGSIVLDFTDLTQYGIEPSHVTPTSVDGYEPGKLVDFSIGTDGILNGRYSNNELRPLGQVPVANVQNPSGLAKHGDSLFVETANSGAFDGVGVAGSLLTGVLEMSNVDLATQFTQMITTQRGFQVNSRVITTSNEMIQEALGLKR